MSATGQGGVTVITGKNHSTLTPVALGSGEQLAFNHNTGRRAFSVIVTSSDGQVLTGADGLFVTQPTVNQITVANTSPGSFTIYVSARWEEPTPELDLVPVDSTKIVIEPLPPPPDTCPADFPFEDATNVGEGPFTFNNDADVLAFAANGYDGVTGGIYITNAVTSLVPLTALKVVQNYLWIENAPGLTSLDGLENLRRVDGNVYLINNATLSDLTALDGLRTVVNSLDIVNNAFTVLDDAFPCLTSVNGIFISNEQSLTSMENFAESLTTIPGNGFYIDDMPLLTSIAGAFPQLITVGTPDGSTSSGVIGIRLCNALATLGGAFPVLVYADTVEFEDNEILDLAGCLPSVITVGSDISLSCYFGSGSPSLDGAFPSLTSMNASDTNTIYILGPRFVSMEDAFPLLATMAGTSGTFSRSIYIEAMATVGDSFASLNTPALVEFIDMRDNAEIDGFNSLVTARAIYVAGSVGSITGFQALTSCTNGLFIEGVTGAPALNLSGSFPLLASLPGTAGGLTFGFLDNTRPLLLEGGFPSLTTVNRLTISGNTGAGTSFKDAFPALTSIASTFAVTTQLTISTNSGLVSLQGALPVLTGTPSFKAVINANGNLTTVAGSFAVLSDGTSFSVTNNVNLPTTAQVAALFAVLTGNGFPGTLTNSGNGPG